MSYESWLHGCTSRYKGFKIDPVEITREAKDVYPACNIMYYTPLSATKSECRKIAIQIIEDWLEEKRNKL